MKKVLPVQGTGGKVPQGAYSLERDRHVSDQYIDTILNNDKCSEKKKKQASVIETHGRLRRRDQRGFLRDLKVWGWEERGRWLREQHGQRSSGWGAPGELGYWS